VYSRCINRIDKKDEGQYSMEHRKKRVTVGKYYFGWMGLGKGSLVPV